MVVIKVLIFCFNLSGMVSLYYPTNVFKFYIIHAERERAHLPVRAGADVDERAAVGRDGVDRRLYGGVMTFTRRPVNREDNRWSRRPAVSQSKEQIKYIYTQ